MKRVGVGVLLLLIVGAAVVMWRSRAGDVEPATRVPPTSTANQSGTERIPPFSPVLVQQLDDLLQSAGVAVLPDEQVFDRGDAAGAEAFAVSQFQLRNMAVEIAGDAGGGWYGSQIDEMVPLPKGVPPLSYFIAAWVDLAATPAAKSASALMGRHNWNTAPQIIFPTVVLTGFVGDAVRAGSQPRTQAARFERMYGRVDAVAAALFVQADSGPCGLISGFIDSIMSKVVNALQIETEDDGFFGFVANLWNTAVTFASKAIAAVVDVLTKPIAAALSTAISVVGILSTISSMLKPWAVRVAADPNPNRYAIDKESRPTGTVTARIDDMGFPGWPSSLVGCAALVGVALPSPDADIGSPVRWTTFGPAKEILNREYRDEVLPAHRVAKLEYSVVGRETKQDAAQGKEIEDTVTIQVGFERRIMTQLQDLIQAMIFGALPGAAVVVKPMLAPFTKAALAKVASLVDATGSTVLRIRHHSLVRCLLFTRDEINNALRQKFTIIAAIPPTGCSAGIPNGGPNLGYYYSAASCQLAYKAVVLTGVNNLDLGPYSFYTRVGDRHRVAFPAASAPANCVMLDAGPVSAISAKDLVRFAATLRPRS